MSNISTRHNVLPFTAGKSEALTGQRLAKIGYKQTEAMTKKGEIAPQSVCASIPRITDQEILQNAEILCPMIREMLEGYQDKVIRSLYESRDCDIAKFSSVSDEEISVQACIGFFISEQNGGRITAEYLKNWFTANMSEFLTVAIAEKLGTEDADDVRITQALSGYRDLFASLSGTKTLLGMTQIDQLTKIIGLCEVADTEIGQWAQKRLTEMSGKNANLSALF